MNRSLPRIAVTASLSICFCASAIAATPPQYAVIDLGVQQSGEGLPWHGIAGASTPPSYPIPPGGSGQILAVNNFASVGFIVQEDGTHHASMWRNVNGNIVLTDLGVLLDSGGVGVPPFSAAYGVNLSGQVVGQSDTPFPVASPNSTQNVQHGFLWQNGVFTDLTPIAGENYFSAAEGINDSHEIVGWTTTISTATHAVLQRAFIYISGTTYNLTFYELGGPTVLLSDAFAINCQGNIAAAGTPASGGSTHSYLLVRQGTPRTCPK